MSVTSTGSPASAISYRVNQPITPEDYIDLLQRSGLAERRPVHDRANIAGSLAASNLLVSAWHGDLLVGVSRSLTDFHQSCYLADLAVDRTGQRSGIGLELIRLTREQLGSICKLILLAAPAAAEYYPRIGFRHDERCWILERQDPLGVPRTQDDPHGGPTR